MNQTGRRKGKDMSTNTNNTPLETLRDGAVKITIWENQGEKGNWYSIEPGRTYTDAAGIVKTAYSFSNGDLLKLSYLLTKAYDRIVQIRSSQPQPEAA